MYSIFKVIKFCNLFTLVFKFSFLYQININIVNIFRPTQNIYKIKHELNVEFYKINMAKFDLEYLTIPKSFELPEEIKRLEQLELQVHSFRFELEV